LIALTDAVDNLNENSLVVHQLFWQQKCDELLDWLAKFHTNNSLLPGATLLQLRQQHNFDNILLSDILKDLVSRGLIIEVSDQLFALKDHTMSLTTRQEEALEKIQKMLLSSNHKPPAFRELTAIAGQPMINTFLQAGLLVKVSDDLVYLPEQIEIYKNWLQNYFESHEKLQLSEFRDHFQTSRKYAQALLEYFDRIHFTERKDDFRVLYQR
ncbi:MAG: SelB C-terminal domain-containing protein, partial [Anaerolineaceae bacterium]|nr:SelB C-terminal domain-containing protein [Anaerolineaceae bacterium]